MIFIEVGVQITRRKFVHLAKDENGRILHADRSIGKVLRWLRENEIYQAEVLEDGHSWEIQLSPLPR